VCQTPQAARLFVPYPWRVRWRNPEKARAWGWAAALGVGPFAVVGVVDQSAYGLGLGLVLNTELGDCEVAEVWLEADD
jgi:hypothetical protein